MQGMRIWVAVVAVLTGLGREIEIVIERVLEDLPGVGRGSRSLRSALTSGLTQPPAKRLGCNVQRSVHDIIQNFNNSSVSSSTSTSASSASKSSISYTVLTCTTILPCLMPNN